MKKYILFCLILIFISSSTYAFRVSSGFGWRINPITGKREFHKGIDIPADTGTPILALFDGIVVFAGPYKGYGLTVIIHHFKYDENKYTLYGHCSKIKVYKGQTVKAGQEIALVGTTGLSTGPHLHLEYWVNNKYENPLKIWECNFEKQVDQRR